MAKKKKTDHKKKSGQGHKFFPIQDLTAERHFQSQITKARKLGSEGKYYEVLSLLYPMREKYADKAELFELLGMAYISIESPVLARDNYAKAVELLTASSKKPNAFICFQLATLYLTTGYAALAYEQIEQLDGEELRRLTDNQLGFKERSELIEQCLDLMAVEAGQPDWPREQLLEYEFALNRGRMALEKIDPATARNYLEEASALNPTATDPYNNLSAAYMLEDDVENAIKQADYVLDNIDPNHILTLSAAVRILVMDSQQERARPYLERLTSLPRPDDKEDLLKMVSAFAFFEDDQKIFDLIQPLLDSMEQMAELDEDDYNEALIFGIVSAIHLGNPEQARLWLQREEDSDDLVILRTWEALENNERGPRENDRFFYFEAETLYGLTLMHYAQEIEKQVESGAEEPNPEFEQFLKKNGPQLLEAMVYRAWVSEEIEEIGEVLGEALSIKEPDGEAVVRRLAFGQQGNELLRLSATATLMRYNIISKEEPVTLWLNGEQRTGKLEELTSWLVSVTSENDEDEDEDDETFDQEEED